MYLLLVILFILYTIYRIAKAVLFQYKKNSSIQRKQNPKDKFGPWVVVTGATDGIGKEYANQFASMGLDVVLISRTAVKLGNFATELNAKYGVQVRTVAVDFTSGVEIYSQLQLALEGLEVGTLVNNVGMTYDNPSYLHELDDLTCVKLLNCNILSATMMMKLLLPSMARRGKGYIVNVGSMANEVSFPFLSLYAATKSFLDKLSHDVGLEYAEHGIFIQSLIPACVATKMSHIKRPSFFAPAPEEFVKSAISSLGRSKRTPGYFSHRIQQIWFRFLRICFTSPFEKYNFNVMNRWRLIAKAKKERESVQ